MASRQRDREEVEILPSWYNWSSLEFFHRTTTYQLRNTFTNNLCISQFWCLVVPTKVGIGCNVSGSTYNQTQSLSKLMVRHAAHPSHKLAYITQSTLHRNWHGNISSTFFPKLLPFLWGLIHYQSAVTTTTLQIHTVLWGNTNTLIGVGTGGGEGTGGTSGGGSRML